MHLIFEILQFRRKNKCFQKYHNFVIFKYKITAFEQIAIYFITTRCSRWFTTKYLDVYKITLDSQYIANNYFFNILNYTNSDIVLREFKGQRIRGGGGHPHTWLDQSSNSGTVVRCDRGSTIYMTSKEKKVWD